MTENRYEPPQSQRDSRAPRQRRSPNVLRVIFILLAMLPAAGIAAGIAFFGLCFAVAESAPRSRDDYGIGALTWGSYAGLIAGAVVLGLMLWWAIALSWPRVEYHRAEKLRRWTKVDKTTFEATFLSMNENEVKLVQLDGTELRVPLKQLSTADRVWLETRL